MFSTKRKPSSTSFETSFRWLCENGVCVWGADRIASSLEGLSVRQIRVVGEQVRIQVETEKQLVANVYELKTGKQIA